MVLKFECKDDDFEIRGDDEDEIVMMVVIHSIRKHPENEISVSDVRDMIEEE